MKKDFDSPVPRKFIRRPLREALLFGAKLDALASRYPSTINKRVDSHGRHVITGRLGGLREYLRSATGAYPYSTAMRYRAAARRILDILELPAGVPGEWIFSGTPVSKLTRKSALAAAVEKGRADLDAILAEARSMREILHKPDLRPSKS